MIKINSKRLMSALLCVIMLLSVIFQAGCADKDPDATLGVTTDGSTPESTPAGNSSDESTPDESTPDESIPGESTPDESTPVETPNETEPGESYNISYLLDGGIDNSNPLKYSPTEELTLTQPLRPGYKFLGWTGGDFTSPTLKATVAKGTKGDLSFTAHWEKNEDKGVYNGINTEFLGKDDGLKAAESTPVSTTDIRGARGEGIYVMKTVYTDISVDGQMDAAYTYGVHFKSDIPSDTAAYNKGHKASFDVYMVRGQNGKVYIYIDVTDSDVVVNDYLFKTLGKPHWCDCLHIYYETGNTGDAIIYYEIVADANGRYQTKCPAGYKLVMTEKGYAVEFSMDIAVAEMSIGVYLNETSNWNESTKTYDRVILKHSSVKNPVSLGYKNPDAKIHDAVRCSAESASGKIDVFGAKGEKCGDILKDLANRTDSVLIVYDENATAQTIISAENLKKYLDSCGVRAFMKREDLIAENETYGYYVLMGMTDRKESTDLISKLNYNGYGISVTDNTIAMVGWNEEAAYTAYDMLFSMIKNGIENGASIKDYGRLYLGSTDGIADGDIPVLEGFDSVTDAGEGAYSIYKLEATMAEYEAYIAALKAKGFKLHTANEIKSVKFATYYNDDTVVSVQFANGPIGGAEAEGADRSLRVVVEPLSNTALPMLEKPADADSKLSVSSVAMICPKDLSTSLCMVVKLSNGEFIIIDSGTNTQSKDLYDYLRKNTDNGQPVVAAWILTHFHQDHIGGFIEYSSSIIYSPRTTVKNIIYNFPAQQVVDNASYSTVDMSNMAKLPGILKKYREGGTTVYQARTGQKYYFGNAEVEILWSYEDIMPFNVFHDRSNPTCIGFTIELEGQRIMCTGDSSTEEFTVAYKKFGDYLKSDFVQLSHHGQGDGGSPVEFYKYVDADYVFQPGGVNYIHQPEMWACNNAKEVYIRDRDGTVVLELPYNGKTAGN